MYLEVIEGKNVSLVCTVKVKNESWIIENSDLFYLHMSLTKDIIASNKKITLKSLVVSEVSEFVLWDYISPT